MDDGDDISGITQDLDGVARPVGPAFDIGAYETTLQKANQTIAFSALSNRALADSPFTLVATASSGLPVQFTSTTPGICTVNGNEVLLLMVGSCTIQADQPGNSGLNPAPPVTRTFDIGIEIPQERLLLPTLEKN